MPPDRSEHNDATSECTLQFINNTAGDVVTCCWVDFHGSEQQYMKLQPGHKGVQSECLLACSPPTTSVFSACPWLTTHARLWAGAETYSTHLWRVRLNSKELVGELVGEYAGGVLGSNAAVLA